MKKIFLLSAITLSAQIIIAQYSYQDVNSQTVTKSLGGIVSDNNGNMIITGQFQTTIKFGSFTLTNNDQDTYWFDHVNDGFISKMAPDGSCIWAVSITNNKLPQKKGCNVLHSGSYIYTVNTDATGNIYITGFIYGSVNFGTIKLTTPGSGCVVNARYIFTAKLSPAGVFLWANVEGTVNSYFTQTGYSVVVDASGNAYTTGFLSQKDYTLNCPIPYNNIWAQWDIYVVKYSATGTKMWEKKYTNNDHKCGEDLVFGSSIVSDGTNVYVSGNFWGTVNFGNNYIFTAGPDNLFLLKLDGNGNTLWATTATITDGNQQNYLLLDNNNQDIYIGGQYAGNGIFGPTTMTNTTTHDKPYLVKYSASSGNLAWAVNAGYTGSGKIFKHPSGNIGIHAADSGMLLTLKEFLPFDGTFENATIATPVGQANPGFLPKCTIVPTPTGFAYSQNLKGSYIIGSATITSTQPFTSSYADMMLVNYISPSLSPSVISGTGSEKDPVQKEILLYPNPASGQITVQDNYGRMLGTIIIYDVSGRIVFKTFAGAAQTILDVEQLPKGFYFLRSDQSASTIRFVKE